MRGDPVSPRLALAALVAITAGGLALRLWALGFGLPDIPNPDELPILNRALALRNNVNPHNVLYPTLYFYALVAWEGLFFIGARLVGLYASVAEFERAYFVDPSRHILAARALTALVGTVSIPALYSVGRRLANRAVALGAALFLAVAPYAVRDAHYIKLDVPVTFFVILSLGATTALVMDPARADRRRGWIVAGALTGLALSTQYYGVFVVVPLVCAALLEGARSGRWRAAAAHLTWAAVAAGAAFLSTSPFVLTDPHQIAVDFAELRKVDIAPAVTAGPFSSLGLYLRLLASDAVGWPVFGLALVGGLLAIVTDRRRGLILLAFPLAFLAFLGNTHPSSRYLSPLVPVMAVAAAYGAWRLAAAVRESRRTAMLVLVIAAAVPPTDASLHWDAFFRRDDTRTLAREFIERTIPPGTTILVQPHGVELRPTRAALVEALRAHLGTEAKASVKFQRELALDPYPAPAYRVLYLGTGGIDVDKIYVAPADGLDGLRAADVAYAVLTRYNSANSTPTALDAVLARTGRLIVRFSPYRAGHETDSRTVEPFLHNTAARLDATLERPGPTIEIWRID
jgi:hypothetical protein